MDPEQFVASTKVEEEEVDDEEQRMKHGINLTVSPRTSWNKLSLTVLITHQSLRNMQDNLNRTPAT